MPFELQQGRHELAAVRVIFHQQYPARNFWVRALFHRNGDRFGRAGQADPDERPGAGLRLDLDLTAVPLRDAVHFRQSESGSHLTFCREERLERPLAHFGGHTDARVRDLEVDMVVDDRRANAEGSTWLHGVEGVLYEVEQRFAKLAGDAPHVRTDGQIALELNLPAARSLGPERTR